MAHSLEMVKNALSSDLAIFNLAGAKACKELPDELKIYKLWERSSSWSKIVAALYGEKSKASDEFVLRSLKNENHDVRLAANWNASNRVFSTEKVLEVYEAFPDDVFEMGGYVEHIDIERSKLASLIYSTSRLDRCLGQRACHDVDSPLEWLLYGLRDKDVNVRKFAINVAKHKEVPIETLYDWAITNDEPQLWRSVMLLAYNSRLGIKIVEKAIQAGVDIDLIGDTVVQMDIPMEVLSEWYDFDLRHRIAALYGSVGNKTTPLEWLGGEADANVQKPLALLKKSLGYPPTRTFTPPDLVYKPCLGGVVLTGTIPDDAEIRGDGVSGRTDKFIVKDVLGDFFGEKVGISPFDLETSYRAGDEVENSDFDMGFKLYAQGIHFNCSNNVT